MIEAVAPKTWQELEEKAAKILREAGFDVACRKEVQTVRGSANVDLVFTDRTGIPPARIFLECKHWQSAVTKAEVHAFRSIVSDAGANSGLLLSSSGFQSGAIEAAESTNVRLINWADFEELYEARWTDHYLRPSLEPVFEELVDLTEPLSGKLLEKMEHLSREKAQPVIAYRDQFTGFAFFGLALYRQFVSTFPRFKKGKIPLPLKLSLPPEILAEMPASLWDIVSARQFGLAMIHEAKTALEGIEREIRNAS